MSGATVARLAPLVGIIARERTGGAPELYDDARQEGLIRVWQAVEARPDAPASYLAGAARNGVSAVVRGRPAFGSPGHQGRKDAADYAGPLTTPGAEEGEEVTLDAVDPAAAEAMRRAELVPIRDAVRAAVAALPEADRAIAVLKFYDGLSWAEIGQALGRGASTVQRRWLEHIAPALRGDLADLRGAA